MHKIIFAHIFAFFIFMGMWYYQPSVTGLMEMLLVGMVALETGFIAFYTQNVAFRLLAVLVWLFFYPRTFKGIMTAADTSWGGEGIWTSGAMSAFMVYMACLLFTLIAGTLSLQLILKSFKLNIYTQLSVILLVAILASFTLYFGRTSDLGWQAFIQSPANYFEQLVANFSVSNMPFMIGLSAIQVMLAVLLGDD